MDSSEKTKKNGRPPTENQKVRIVETGEIFNNYREAAESINGNRSCVYLCLKGYRKQHLGFTFEYVEVVEDEEYI